MNANIYENQNKFEGLNPVDYLNRDHENLRLYEVLTLPTEYCLKKGDHLGRFEYNEVEKCLDTYLQYKKQYFS